MGNQIKSVGIIGAGQMGGGIAHVCAMAGYDVYVSRHFRRSLPEMLATISGNLARQVASGKTTETERGTHGSRADQLRPRHEWPRSHGSRHRGSHRRRNRQAQDLFQQLCPQLKPEAILATNTSSISITRLAAATDRPERFIGIHFMNPVPVMKLVELVRGIATEDETFEAARGFIESLGKTITVTEDFPGLHRQPHPAADDQRGDLHAL
jgi:3-hydroxybutyryl-CoA dehydrogenase